MEEEKLQRQYDRFLSQAREEARDLYWLYNFFFVIESALIGALLVGKLAPEYLATSKVVGLILAIYWLSIVHKQRLWRNNLINRIQKIEEELGYKNDLQIWPIKEKLGTVMEYLFGKRGLWRFLFLLPIGFVVLWVSLF